MRARTTRAGADDPSTAEHLTTAARFPAPELFAFHVHRPRLLDLLAKAESLPLVLVSAPAGTGKTSLVAEWVRSTTSLGPVGWVTLEERDSAFWGPLLECLRGLGLDARDPGGSPPSMALLGTEQLEALAAEIAARPELLTVVLDGCELTTLELARQVDYLLRHSLGQLRLVFVGRVDPVLPLYRYRLVDALVEVRAADLAFTDDEAAELLRGMGVALSRSGVHNLNERTKGWVAGLRFAARALAVRDDPEESVAVVVAQDGDINEYLVGEVLDAQTPELRSFLLHTSVPDVLLPGLVEELVGPGAPHTLAALARSKAFIESVPDPPGAYRYYPFFRSMLRAQLLYESPETSVELHRRAARWYARGGMVDRSLTHLATIDAWDEVAHRIVQDRMVGRVVLEGRGGLLGCVAARLPTTVETPSACVVRAAAALAVGDRATCASELVAARAGGVEDRALRLSIVVLDAARAALAESADTAAALAEEAERALVERPPVSRTGPGSEMYALVQHSLGVTRLRRGAIGSATKLLTLAAGLDGARAAGSFRAEVLGHLAMAEALGGALSKAGRTAGESADVCAAGQIPSVDRPPAAAVALALVAVERYDLTAARRHVASARTSRWFHDDPVARGLAEGVVACVERVGGHLRPALARLEAAAAAAAATDPWLADHLRVEAARLSMASGKPELALSTLSVLEPVDDPMVAVTAAAAHAEQGHDAAVAAFLTRAHNTEPPLQVQVGELLVEAVQESRHRSPAGARNALDRSLRLAAPEGLRRPFREAGPTVQRFLSADPRIPVRHPWLGQVGETGLPVPVIPAQRVRPPVREKSQETPAVVEALTPKELEVLGNLQELLTNQEIADTMFVSVNTVRTHVRSILRKLGVSRRSAAVRKARQLGLIGG